MYLLDSHCGLSCTSLSIALNPNWLHNMAVIVEVDHGKTMLMDLLLRQCGADIPHERPMDSISLKCECDITIVSKDTGRMEGGSVNVAAKANCCGGGASQERTNVNTEASCCGWGAY
ncbi:unnamed protein product [Prunus brigantina]